MLRDYELGQQLLLIGNQGVTRTADGPYAAATTTRALQLHRDTSVADADAVARRRGDLGGLSAVRALTHGRVLDEG